MVGVRVLRNLKPDEFARLEKQFAKYDKSGTGKMTPSDLKKFYKGMPVQSGFGDHKACRRSRWASP